MRRDTATSAAWARRPRTSARSGRMRSAAFVLTAPRTTCTCTWATRGGEGAMRIADFYTSRRVLVMAELGNNHEGQPEVGRELVERAAEAGAGAVKLQTYEPERFVRPRDADRLAQLKRFQLHAE